MNIGIDARLINETGVGRYIRNLIRELCTLDTINTYVVFLNADEFSKFIVPNARWRKVLADVPWHTITEQVRMPWIFHKEQLDLLHVPYFNIPILYTGAMVVTIHDLTIQHFDTGKASTHSWILYKTKRLLYIFVLFIGIAKAKHIIVPSIATKEEILRHYPVGKQKISVTYEAVDREITKSPQGITHEKPLISTPYFLCVGNAYPHKNYFVVVDALLRSNRKMKLVFVGKEDFFYKRLKLEIIQKGLSSRVVFFGWADDKSLRSLYTHAEAFIFPSLMEGFGLPPLEAIFCGCPVIASDIAVHKEILKDLVTYFSPNDALQLVHLLDNWKKADHSIAKERIRALIKMYNWRSMAIRTLQIYERCNRL